MHLPIHNTSPALERTYLAYIRTSNTIASFAVLTVQLFILRRGGNVAAVSAGKALACIAIAVAIVTVIAGTRRYFKQQGLLQEQKFPTRGYDLIVLIGLYLAVSQYFITPLEDLSLSVCIYVGVA